MNIPTNKVRDLIATLKLIDPDTEHKFLEIDVQDTRRGRRYLVVKMDEDTTRVNFEDFLDKLYIAIPRESREIAEDLNTPDEFIEKLSSYLTYLHNDIRALRLQVDELQSSTNTTA